MINAVYWFRMCSRLAPVTSADFASILLHIQVRLDPVDGSSPDRWCPDHVPILHPASLLSLLFPVRQHLSRSPREGRRSQGSVEALVDKIEQTAKALRTLVQDVRKSGAADLIPNQDP